MTEIGVDPLSIPATIHDLSNKFLRLVGILRPCWNLLTSRNGYASVKNISLSIIINEENTVIANTRRYAQNPNETFGSTKEQIKTEEKASILFPEVPWIVVIAAYAKEL